MGTTSTIVILDDEPERIRAMRECLSSRLPRYRVVTFDNAPDMIGWLKRHVEDACLICLDHDPGPNRSRNGDVFDPGTGRDVAEYLATRRPICPVLIHTSNSLAAPGMAMVLDDSGWVHSRVYPYNDLEWVSADWVDEVGKALGNP
jgi:CheY-like chemotaxis protein